MPQNVKITLLQVNLFTNLKSKTEKELLLNCSTIPVLKVYQRATN